MKRRGFVQVSHNGAPLLSYWGDPGFVLSPSTMPGSLIQAIAESLGFDGPAGISYSTREKTEMWPSHVFHGRALVDLLVGRMTGPHACTFVDATTIPLEWDSVEDYRY